MAQTETIRVAFVGAGGIARSRHLPQLSQIPGAEVRVVANRTLESGRAIAAEFGIPEVATDWQDVISRDDIDAVFIGTWPYMHSRISVAALEAEKHVFCQARMAATLAEAREMVNAADAHPAQVNMICPPPHRMPWEPYIRRLVGDGSLGTVWAVRVRSLSDANLATVPTWRERVEFSGIHTLAVGIYAETLNAWVGDYTELSARTATPIATKVDETGAPYRIRIPQVVSIHGRLANGTTATELHSGISAHEREDAIVIEGSEGTLRVDAMKSIRFAPRGGTLDPIEVPSKLKRGWCVESDFVEAVRAARRGDTWSVSPDFHEGLRYMTKMHAIVESAESGRTVGVDVP